MGQVLHGGARTTEAVRRGACDAGVRPVRWIGAAEFAAVVAEHRVDPEIDLADALEDAEEGRVPPRGDLTRAVRNASGFCRARSLWLE